MPEEMNWNEPYDLFSDSLIIQLTMIPGPATLTVTFLLNVWSGFVNPDWPPPSNPRLCPDTSLPLALPWLKSRFWLLTKRCPFSPEMWNSFKPIRKLSFKQRDLNSQPINHLEACDDNAMVHSSSWCFKTFLANLDFPFNWNNKKMAFKQFLSIV